MTRITDRNLKKRGVNIALNAYEKEYLKMLADKERKSVSRFLADIIWNLAQERLNLKECEAE